MLKENKQKNTDCYIKNYKYFKIAFDSIQKYQSP